MEGLFSLSNDLLNKVFTFLKTKEYVAVCQVCCLLNDIISDYGINTCETFIMSEHGLYKRSIYTQYVRYYLLNKKENKKFKFKNVTKLSIHIRFDNQQLNELVGIINLFRNLKSISVSHYFYKQQVTKMASKLACNIKHYHNIESVCLDLQRGCNIDCFRNILKLAVNVNIAGCLINENIIKSLNKECFQYLRIYQHKLSDGIDSQFISTQLNDIKHIGTLEVGYNNGDDLVHKLMSVNHIDTLIIDSMPSIYFTEYLTDNLCRKINNIKVSGTYNLRTFLNKYKNYTFDSIDLTYTFTSNIHLTKMNEHISDILLGPYNFKSIDLPIFSNVDMFIGFIYYVNQMRKTAVNKNKMNWKLDYNNCKIMGIDKINVIQYGIHKLLLLMKNCHWIFQYITSIQILLRQNTNVTDWQSLKDSILDHIHHEFHRQIIFVKHNKTIRLLSS